MSVSILHDHKKNHKRDLKVICMLYAKLFITENEAEIDIFSRNLS